MISERKTQVPLVQDALDIIHSKYPYLLGSTDISEILQVSSPHLIRSFKAELGVSPTKYLIHYKLERSRKLLLQEKLYVDTVANLVGFSCGNYYAKAFKKAYGLTPSQYIAQQQKEEGEGEDFPELYL